jgi:acyl carrier protein
MELEDTYGIRIPDDQAAQLLTVGESADWIARHAPQNAT